MSRSRAACFLFRTHRVGGGDTFLMRFLKWLYAPVLRLAIRFPLPLVAASVAVFGLPDVRVILRREKLPATGSTPPPCSTRSA